jgi:hypothetical protein
MAFAGGAHQGATMQLVNDIAFVAIVVGVAMVVTEWMRQRGSLKQKVEELQAWRETQNRNNDDYHRTYAESVQLQRDGQAQAQAQAKENQAAYLRFNESHIALNEARIKVAQDHLEEVRKTNDLLSQLINVLREQPVKTRDGGPTGQ